MKKRAEKYLLFLVLMVTLLGSCVATTVKQATIRETIDVPTAIDTKPLLFKKIVVVLPRGEKISATQASLLYIPSAPLTWHGGRVTPSGYEFKEVFREDLAIIRLANTPTNRIPHSVQRCDQNAISLRKEGVGQEQDRVDEADRLNFFLFLYCHTFESKDIDKFATLFAHDALENDKPFHELLPRYRRNMEMIESLDYRIELVNYSLQANTGNIRLQGKFSIRYLLYVGTWKEKSGNISMELTKRGISYLIKRLNYSDEP